MQLFPRSTMWELNRPAAPLLGGIPDAAGRCAALLLETMPRILKAVRASVKNQKALALNVPQFRALIFVHQHAGESLSAMAEFLGLSLPSASKLVDGLVKRLLLVRENDPADRRRMTLRLTRKGDALVTGAQESVRHDLAAMLGRMDQPTLEVLSQALIVLMETFPRPGEATPGEQQQAAGQPPEKRNQRVS